MISQELMKWLITLLTGALGSFLITCRKQIVEFFKFKKKKQEQKMLEGVNQEIDTLGHQMEHHEDEIAIELKAHDQLYAKRLAEVEERLMLILNPMREALLSSHYQALLEKCKRYVQAGQLTADELDSLEKDYQTYKKLGGNGHMELWMIRVRQLKVI